MKKKHIRKAAVAIALILGLLWLLWGNVTVGLTAITVTEEELPAGFDGYRIAHVSDLHNTDLWKQAIDRLEEAQPDIICITGDFVDSNRTNISVALEFAEAAVKIAPCYYVTGNHEMLIDAIELEALMLGLRDCGVTVLMDEAVLLTKGTDSICLVGHKWGGRSDFGTLTDFDGYNVLLAHQPEVFSDFVAGGYDLVLCGHVHGGQIRLPFIGGLYGPDQGVLPEYDSGLYSDGYTDMVVSRGIGNSVFPIRFYNRPEVVLVTLQCGSSQEVIRQ